MSFKNSIGWGGSAPIVTNSIDQLNAKGGAVGGYSTKKRPRALDTHPQFGAAKGMPTFKPSSVAQGGGRHES